MPRSYSPPGGVLLTGSSGFLGGLLAAEALAGTDAEIVLPIRDPAQEPGIRARLRAELERRGGVAAASAERATGTRGRLRFVALPPLERMQELVPALRAARVSDVIHCAGCLLYGNEPKLRAGNVELTQRLLDASRRADVRRFTFVSTAYSSGITDGVIREDLHHRPGLDPTPYTRTKREAEHLVARSGLPFLIVRPSIVIGDSVDGRYQGQPFGIYQLWSSGVSCLDGAFPERLHVVAGAARPNFLHQDAFVSGFFGAWRRLPEGSAIHLISREDALPTMRALWRLWVESYGGPAEVHFHPSGDGIPRDELDEAQLRFIDLTAVNSAIAATPWRFERSALEALCKDGLHFPDATLATLEVAQRRFVADHPEVQRFIDAYRARGSARPRFVEHDADASGAAAGAWKSGQDG
jgi:nucleoside-diphosphate-sugar epimerase